MIAFIFIAIGGTVAIAITSAVKSVIDHLDEDG